MQKLHSFCFSVLLVAGFVFLSCVSADDDIFNTTMVATTGIVKLNPIHKSNGTSKLFEDERRLKELRGIYDESKVCNRTWFTKNYVNQDKYIDLHDLRLLCKSHTTSCNNTSLPRHVFYQLLEDLETDSYYLNLHIEDIDTYDSECWGLAYQEVSSVEKKIEYFNFYEKENEKQFPIYYRIGETYKGYVGSLPRGLIFEFEVVAPGACEIEVLHDIHLKLVELGFYHAGCKHRLDLNDQFEFSRHLCKNYQPEERRRIIREQVKFKDCMIFISEKTKEENKTKILISAIAVVLVIIVSLIIVCMARRNKMKLFQNKKTMLCDTEEQLLQTNFTRNKDRQQKVMILHRPGCEIMDLFIMELGGLLKSYGIHVKVTLTEQNIMDEEGGIASYMQRNIDQCDFILIVLTEASGEEAILKHRPFEFAMTMLQGEAVYSRTSSSARYVPLYLKTYSDAVTMFPPFLNASTGYGFQIPKEFSQLISYISSTAEKKSKERKIKDTHFLNNMKKLSKSYQQREHDTCNAEECRKGRNFPSTSNLSSSWVSTVPTMSKWPSLRSENLLECISETGFCIDLNDPLCYNRDEVLNNNKSQPDRGCESTFVELPIPNVVVELSSTSTSKEHDLKFIKFSKSSTIASSIEIES